MIEGKNNSKNYNQKILFNVQLNATANKTNFQRNLDASYFKAPHEKLHLILQLYFATKKCIKDFSHEDRHCKV
jgi:hypothetical protein